MLEMVIVAPVLLLLLFAIAEFGIAFAQWQTLSNAAREGARVGVVFRDPATCNAGAVQAQVATTVANYAALMGMAVPAGAVNTTGACAGTGTPVSVQVTFPHSFVVLPNLQNMFGGGSVPAILNIAAAATMRNE
jgi:Flp pilus assembly protein TadG